MLRSRRRSITRNSTVRHAATITHIYAAANTSWKKRSESVTVDSHNVAWSGRFGSHQSRARSAIVTVSSAQAPGTS